MMPEASQSTWKGAQSKIEERAGRVSVLSLKPKKRTGKRTGKREESLPVVCVTPLVAAEAACDADQGSEEQTPKSDDWRQLRWWLLIACEQRL